MSTGHAAFGDLLRRADEEEVAGTGSAQRPRSGPENARGLDSPARFGSDGAKAHVPPAPEVDPDDVDSAASDCSAKAGQEQRRIPG